MKHFETTVEADELSTCVIVTDVRVLGDNQYRALTTGLTFTRDPYLESPAEYDTFFFKAEPLGAESR